MKKILRINITAILFFGFGILLICLFNANPVKAETQVSGEVKKGTVWTEANSPYTLIRTIEIPKSVTLTIEPGVTVNMPGGFNMFSLKGKLVALGEEEKPIIFNGYGNSLFINAQNSTNLAFADLDYCRISNLTELWNHGFGYFHLRHSLIENISGRSYVWYPADDVYIEYNEFSNVGGFAIGVGEDTKVYIRYNYWHDKYPGQPEYEDYFIQNWSSLNDGETIVSYNTFQPTDGIILELPGGYSAGAIMAENNYWGTTDEDVIATMIYDQNDDATAAGIIEFKPILDKPHPDTPGTVLPEPPVIDDYAATTTAPILQLSGTKATDTALLIDGGEIIVLSATTTWEAVVDLELGENNFLFSTRNEQGFESGTVTVTTKRLEGEEGECLAWTYSEWSECVDNSQARDIITALPEGCAGGEPVLTQACSIPAEVNNTIAEEKALVRAVDEALAKRLSGLILLQVEKNGEAWYVYPADMNKYYLGRPADAFAIMRALGLGASHEFIAGHTEYPAHVLGKILIDVDDLGKAYYIYPKDGKAYYLGKPADAFAVMRELGLGITNENIRKIMVGEVD